MWGIVFAVGIGILAQEDILVAVHDFNAPMVAVEGEEVLWCGFCLGEAGDEIGDFLGGRLPDALFPALNNTAHPADLGNAWPVPTHKSGLGGKHINDAPLNAAMGLLNAAVMGPEGGKPAV